jgi:hypothetical protein
MWRSRVASALCITHLCRGEHLVAKVWAEVLGRPQIYFAPAQDRRHLPLHRSEREESGRVSSLKLDEHVNIALRMEIFAQDGAEERETTDVMTAAEVG